MAFDDAEQDDTIKSKIKILTSASYTGVILGPLKNPLLTDSTKNTSPGVKVDSLVVWTTASNISRTKMNSKLFNAQKNLPRKIYDIPI